MRILNRQDREDLGIAKLPPKVRDYIAELETEYERVTTRQKRLRDNIRAMQVKCENMNLRLRLAQLAGQAKAQQPVGPPNLHFHGGKQMQRAV